MPSTLKAHPAAALFPLMDDAAIDALADDIAEHGLTHPIVVFDGMILDGRNRAEACRRKRIANRMVRLDACESPTAYVISANLHRRHLTGLQKAVVSVDALPLFQAEAAARERAGKSSDGKAGGRGKAKPKGQPAPRVSGKATDLAAAATGAGQKATKSLAAIKQNAPDVFAAVKAGLISTVADAKRCAELPAEQRAAVLGRIRDDGVDPRQAVRESKRERQLAAIAAESPVIPGGRYRVIVADPPWPYSKRENDPTHRGACPYPSMSVSEICALPVADHAEEGCILWLWTTNAFMHEAFHVAEAWGFEPKTILTWAKNKMGLGDWLRGQTEHCIMAVRGKPIVALTNQTTILHANAGKHSEKPEEFYALIEALCPGSKLELFARRRRDGWAAFGDEVRE